MTKQELICYLKELAQLRPVFHSEADFQHELGCLLKSKGHQVRLERPYYLAVPNFPNRLKVELDLEVDGMVAIELKLKTALCSMDVNGEIFNLKDHSAPNLGRFDFVDDARRVRYLVDHGPHKFGFSVLLTNSQYYWANNAENTMSASFDLTNGRAFQVGQILNWNGNPGSNSVSKKRLAPFAPIAVHFNETTLWNEYSERKGIVNGKFKFLVLDVNNP
jgi:hypothetical protein